MNFEVSPAEAAFRSEVNAFFRSEPSTEKMAAEIESGAGFGPGAWEILGKLGSRGWLCPTWPKKYGGMETVEPYRYIVMDEMDYFTGKGNLNGAGVGGPIILRRGTEEQKNFFLPLIAAGKIEFALGYTEPQAGSDLASLSIRAEDKGDHFLVNGQKMFNTDCHFAQYHWLGARTAETKPKYKGISLFVVDLKTPGITLRPLWTVDGLRSNEVFYDDVKVPCSSLVGEVNRGFYYIVEALARERSLPTGTLRRSFEMLVEYVKESGSYRDPDVRQKIGQLSTELEIARLLSLRIPWMLEHGVSLNHEPAMLKVFISEFRYRMADIALQLLGPAGQIRGDSRLAPIQGKMEWNYRESVRRMITAGTTEIMRNIIAERGLGMAKAS